MQHKARSVFALMLIVAQPAIAADVSGYLVATSDYVYRGVTQSDGHAALQGGLDVGFDTGLFMGVWASTVDIEGQGDLQRDTEIRGYLGYGFDISERFRLVTTVVAYRYPGSEGSVDYDNHETSLSLGIDDRYWIEYAYSPNLYDTGRDTHNIELFAEWPFGDAFSASIGVGRFYVDRPGSLPETDSFYWQAGVTRTFTRLDIDLRYHDASDPVWFTSTPDRIGSRVVLSARIGF